MKILYLTFYFEPDLCAGSFRNTPLAKALSKSLCDNDCIEVITTVPQRYSTYKKDNVVSLEKNNNLHIYRIKLPAHNNNFIGLMNSFRKYFFDTIKKTKNNDYDLIFASSSRLFTAFLGCIIAQKSKKPLYLDIRDIFAETINDLIKNRFLKLCIIPIIKITERITFNNAYHINLISEGFKSYFKSYKCKSYSYFTHGIDEEFLSVKLSNHNKIDHKYKIVYAGNIGEGQGLEKIVPYAAELLGNDYTFHIIGDGGTKAKLQNEIKRKNLINIELQEPIDREKLKSIYSEADFLFIHLNNYKAFERVLPSKIFELAAYDKPIIAGVTGFSYQFIEKYVNNVVLFKSCDVNSMVEKLKTYTYRNEYRSKFLEQFRRDDINAQIVSSILDVINHN